MPNIVVLVKRVPDTNARIVVSGDRVDLSAVKWVISPYDEFAIETALQHKEAAGGSVTALTMGPAGADKILKDAKDNGVNEIKAEFIPTQKNMPAENFLSDNGFKKDGSFWIYNLNNDIKSPNHLEVEIEK